MRYLGLAILVALGLIVAFGSDTPKREQKAASGIEVDEVIDGDTLATTDRARIRLLQIDTPETYGGKECYGPEATKALTKLLPPGARVRLEKDPGLDDEDRYGRKLRYVFVGSKNLNRELVKMGAASVYFYRGERGIYASELLKDAKSARKRKAGMWGACPNVTFNPERAVASN